MALATVGFSATAAPMLAREIGPQLEARIEAATAGRIAQIDAAVGDAPAPAATPRVRPGETTYAEQRVREEQREAAPGRRGERRGKRRRARR
jgi:hypothetical protein